MSGNTYVRMTQYVRVNVDGYAYTAAVQGGPPWLEPGDPVIMETHHGVRLTGKVIREVARIDHAKVLAGINPVIDPDEIRRVQEDQHLQAQVAEDFA